MIVNGTQVIIKIIFVIYFESFSQSKECELCEIRPIIIRKKFEEQN